MDVSSRANTTSLVQSPLPKSRFISLPPEIRNTIYELLVVKENPIRVCSPRRKHVVNKEFTSKAFASLLRLNRQINTEASTTFYSKNRFVFGNGLFGSTSNPNAHGFKAFLERVPKKYLAHIVNVLVEVHCRRSYHSISRGGFQWVLTHGSHVWELGSMNDANSLHSISRALGTHFKGLEVVAYQKKDTGPSLFSTTGSPNTTMLSPDEAKKQLEKTLLLTLKNENLKELRFFSSSRVDMEASVKKILVKKPDAARILKVIEPS